MDKADMRTLPGWIPDRCLGLLLVLLGLAVSGCGQAPPPKKDDAKMEKEWKQLQEHRQKEWNNQ
jgi:hypothetical protein